ncbi:MAG: type III pantothenate kinase [Mycoplasmoidaceae bacterium]|nr:type III pantothenate kinase [Mycoplasmoidaceae bacterium]
METKTNYLIIDMGNSNYKAAVYDIKQNKIIEMQQIPQTPDAKKLIDLFACLKNGLKIDGVVESLTSKPEVAREFNESLAKIYPVQVKIIGKDDFAGLVDLSNVDPKVIIGTDILTLAYYGITTLQKGVIVCLGTVYFSIMFDSKQIKNVLFVPSLVRGLKGISSVTSIDAEQVPEVFDKTIGLNTKDAFSAGANLLLEGAIDNVVKEYGLASFNVLITGGDARKFANIGRKYKVVDNLLLIALAMLTKEKG